MAALGDTNVSFPVSSSFAATDPYTHQRVIGQCISASLTVLTGSATSQLVLPANRNRLGLFVVNDSPSICYLRLGQGPANSNLYSAILPILDITATNKFVQINNGHAGSVVFTGEIHCQWLTATGSLKITELT